MCKKNFVVLAMHKRRFRMVVDDIAAVHTVIRKKRPAIPAYESQT